MTYTHTPPNRRTGGNRALSFSETPESFALLLPISEFVSRAPNTKHHAAVRRDWQSFRKQRLLSQCSALSASSLAISLLVRLTDSLRIHSRVSITCIAEHTRMIASIRKNYELEQDGSEIRMVLRLQWHKAHSHRCALGHRASVIHFC